MPIDFPTEYDIIYILNRKEGKHYLRYIVGCSLIDKQDKSEVSGVLIQDEYGLGEIQQKDNPKEGEFCVLVFEQLQAAQKFLSVLARENRRRDVKKTPKEKSRTIKKWYLLKLDSPKCFIKLLQENTIHNNPYGYKRYIYSIM